MQREKLAQMFLKTNIIKLQSSFSLSVGAEILSELEEDLDFLNQINQKINSNQIFRKRNFKSVYEFNVYRNLIYYFVRAIKPKVVVETGVLHGLTSAWILNALEKNGDGGKLISIDLPRRDWHKYFPSRIMGPGPDAEYELGDHDPGWVIPENLRANWELYLGPSEIYLANLTDSYEIDLFIHDSDHSYEVMKFECELIFGNSQGYVIIDDFIDNPYLFEKLASTVLNYVFMEDLTEDNQVRNFTAFIGSDRNGVQ